MKNINISELENNFIEDYWKTLTRKNISNIEISKFLKKPYLEDYIIELSAVIDNIDDKIINLIESNKIDMEDILLFIKNNFEFNIEEKKNLETYFLKNNFADSKIYILANNLINYQIDYFRFYQIIIELLFENDNESNELYNFILIYIKNNKNSIKQYCNNNIKFKIFYYYINILSDKYKNIYNLLDDYKFINCNDDDDNDDNDQLSIQNLFLKNIFTNWYNIYKKDILENNVNEKIKEHTIRRSILSRILCLPNL